jgi:hypothetical protein
MAVCYRVETPGVDEPRKCCDEPTVRQAAYGPFESGPVLGILLELGHRKFLAAKHFSRVVGHVFHQLGMQLVLLDLPDGFHETPHSLGVVLHMFLPFL